MLTPFRAALAGAVLTAAFFALALAPQPGGRAPEPTAKDVQRITDKALVFLKTQQAADGSFSAQRAGPGITAVVVAALLRNGQSPKEPVIAKALAFLEK